MSKAEVMRGPVTTVALVAPPMVLAACAVAVVAWGTPAAPGRVAVEFSFAAAWVVVGLAALRYARETLGRLALVLGAATALTIPSSLGLATSTPVTDTLVTVGVLAVAWQLPIIAHLLLTYPGGRVDSAWTRVLLVLAYGLAWCEFVLQWHTGRPYAPKHCETCAESLIVPRELAWSSTVLGSIATAWGLIACAAVVVAFLRYRKASRRRRQVLAYPLVAVSLSAGALLILAAIAAWQGRGILSTTWAVVLAQVVSLFGVPLALVSGVWREQRMLTQVSRSVEQMTRQGTDLDGVLASVLGDPDLRLVYPASTGWVSADGGVFEPSQLAPDEMFTVVSGPLGPLGAIVHDVSLADEPALLSAAGSVTQLALDNDRLSRELSQRLADLRASRTRVVSAGVEARRRIERDLHDGAQQHLLAASMSVARAAEQPDLAQTRRQLQDAADQIQGAIHSLRNLAAGIYPPVLTERGLEPALRALARQAPVPVTITGTLSVALAPSIRDAAFFCTSELLTNAFKHSAADEVEVRLSMRGDLLVVEVRDDGCGGADPSGLGLTGVADRAAAVDGRLELVSPAGHGTMARLKLPSATHRG